MYIVGKCLLRDKLSQKHMTQQELANRLNISKQQINSYATNRRIMTYQVAYNIATILRCEMSELYEWESAKDNKK